MESSAPTATRKQLRGYGASHYIARRLTASLTPIAKVGNAYVYTIDQVIAAIREYRLKARTQLATKQLLEQMMVQLLTRLNNVVPLVSAKDSTTEVSDVARQLLHQMRRTDQAIAELKAASASTGQH